jgi:outer membrane protein assembly factor BamB
VDWLVETSAGLLGAPVLLADGRVSRYEDGAVVTRDGTATATAPAGGPALAALGDDLLCGAPGSPALRRIAPDGTVRWSVPLVAPLSGAPVRTGDVVVAADGPLLRGYDPDGTPRWIAGELGFAPPDAPPVTVADGMVRAAPLTLPDGSLVAQVTERYGYGFVRFAPADRTVAPLRPPVAIHGPVAAVALPGGGPALAALGPAEEVERGSWRWMVVLVDTSGTVLWSYRLGAEPAALVAAGAGGVAVVCSPPLGRWEKYHGWYDLTGECFVRCLGPQGGPLWTWYPPIPVPYRPAAGADGTIFVAGPGRLWALGA